MKRALLLIVVGALYVLHQDFWFWRAARPLVFGFIPIGLFYHACYAIVTAVVMWMLVKHAWPSYLEEGGGEERGGDAHSPALSLVPRPVAADREDAQH